MKKFSLVLVGALMSLAIITIAPKTVSAMGMPCTQTEMDKALAQVEAAKQQVAACTVAKQQAEANYSAVSKTNCTELEKLVAYNDLVNKTNQLSYAVFWQNECQKYYDNAYSRAWSEQYKLDMNTKWANRATVDTLKMEATNKQDIANQALNQLNDLKNTLAYQTECAKSNAGLMGVVNELTAKVAQTEADYQAKAAAAALAQTNYQNASATLNFATNEDNAQYFAYVQKCVDAVKQPGSDRPVEHDIMCWYD